MPKNKRTTIILVIINTFMIALVSGYHHLQLNDYYTRNIYYWFVKHFQKEISVYRILYDKRLQYVLLSFLYVLLFCLIIVFIKNIIGEKIIAVILSLIYTAHIFINDTISNYFVFVEKYHKFSDLSFDEFATSDIWKDTISKYGFLILAINFGFMCALIFTILVVKEKVFKGDSDDEEKIGKKKWNASDYSEETYMDYFNSLKLPLREYYDGDMEPYEVLYEQVGDMLDQDIIEEFIDILTAKEFDLIKHIESDVTEDISLDNPEDNPLHSANRDNNKEQIYGEITGYVETGLMVDFLKDYHGKKADKNYKTEAKEYDISTVENVMRTYIEKFDQPEMLLTYCVIALYKNTPDYRKFSLNAARTYCAAYIQTGIVKYDDLFTDLIALLMRSEIIEKED